nr:hypothetical protein [Tanacetum cinerariifolium]
MQTQTSNTLHNAIMEAGGKDRLLMLAPGNYVQWKSIIKRYIVTKPNYELINYCLMNPPYKYTWADKAVLVTEGSSETTTKRYMENYKNVSQDICDQLNAEAEVVQIILTEIANDIYSIVYACPNACEMEQIDQDDDDDDIANERDLLASLIEKLKCEIDDIKNRNKFLETSNKVLVDKLKGQIEDFKTKNKSLESSNNDFKEANNELSKTNKLMYKDLKKFQVELDRHNDVKNEKELFAHPETISILSQQKVAQIKFHKTRKDKVLDKVISLENKIKVLDKFVYKTVQTMNMLNRNCKTSFAKLEFLKKAQRENPRLYDIGCYNDNLALMLAPESEEDLKAQLHDKGITISELKKLIEKLKGKCIDTKIAKSSVIHQPNAFKSQRPSILGKPTIFSDSLERKDCSKSKSVTKNNMSNDFSKLATTQILPLNKKSILKNTNVLAPGLYKLHTAPTQTRTTQFPYDSRKTNKRVCFSTGVIPPTSVSRPQLKSSQIEDRVMLNNNQGKKQEVEDHRRNVKFSKNKMSVTACNDSLNAKSSNVNIVFATCKKCVLNVKHDICVLHSLNGVNSRTKIPIAMPISTREPKRIVKQSAAKPLRRTLVEIIIFIIDSWCSKHMTRNLKLLYNFVDKFLGLVKFGNDQITPILGYGDLVQGLVTIKRVYYVEGLNHNLFSVDQFCDADLEVAFRKSTCYIRDLKGNDQLTGSRGTDLYSITLQDTFSLNPMCLMAKATSSQAWLWHRRLSHLNFDTINLLSKNDIVIGLPKLKFVKDHLCSSCKLGKAKRNSFQTKTTPSSKRQLQLLHMDLCGPMRVESINGRKYVLVIIDDYSRYTWTHFLRSKDETSEVLIDFLKLVQRGLHAQEFVTKRPLPEHLNKTALSKDGTVHIDGENLDKMKEKGDACIFVGYSTQSRAYRVFNKRTRVIVETIHINFDELPQMALDHVSSVPVPKCQSTALEHISLSPGPQCQEKVHHAAGIVTTSNELDSLFSPMFDELLNGSTQVLSKSSAVTTAEAPNQCQQQNTTPLYTQTTPEPTCQVPTQAPTVTSTKSINQAETISENVQVEDDKFINIFCTPEELHQFDRLDVWELLDRPLCKNIINMKWLRKNKRDEENTVI